MVMVLFMQAIVFLVLSVRGWRALKIAAFIQVSLRCGRLVEAAVFILSVRTVAQQLQSAFLLIFADSLLNSFAEQLQRVCFLLDLLHHEFVSVALLSDVSLAAPQRKDI